MQTKEEHNMKRNIIIMLLIVVSVLTGCKKSGDTDIMIATPNNQTDGFNKETYNSNIDNTQSQNTKDSDKPVYAGGINEETFTIKEHTDKKYTEEELQEIEKQYEEAAAPNIVIDETEEENNKTQEENEDKYKKVTIDGEEFEVYVNE